MLEIRALTHDFGDRRALDDVSLEVTGGEIVGFVGPNGAGKTTTMRVVLGVLAPGGGTITWRGAPITHEMRHDFGYLPEERGLYPKMPLREQLAFFAELKGLDAPSALASADRWLARMGLTERAGDALETLSLGNQQRVQLAAALVHDPSLLVLDEPFSGLDPSAVDELSDVLRELARHGAAILLSSHQLGLVERLCDRVVILIGGRVVASGTVGELGASDLESLFRDTAAGAPSRAQKPRYGRAELG